MRPPLILAYHGLGSYTRTLDPHNLMLQPERFRRQISSLKRRDYRFVSLMEFVGYLDGDSGRRPPGGLCVLTFDDGTMDNLEVLEPLLAELEVPATVFACPGLLGAPHFSMAPASGVRLMDAEELRQLDASPFVEIGSHTMSHADLSTATADEAYRDMLESRLALEELLGRPVLSFAYPKCVYSAACPEAARRAGYQVAVTCAGRGAWQPFELSRASIDSLDRSMTFALKSRGLFGSLRESPFGKVARAAARPVRHPSERHPSER
jgi:peptidoglycan/xylan/chitin deacetylase (PgdA/CDA1 family)